MARQEMFDAAVRGLRAQGWAKSAGHVTGEADSRCLYRGPRGLKCAVGHCYTDEELRSAAEQEGADFEELDASALIELLGGTWEAADFAIEMQAAHDNATSAENMVRLFRLLGRNYDLTWPEEAADA